MKDILSYESDIWSCADLLISSGIKQSKFPDYMMPFFALIMLEGRMRNEMADIEASEGLTRENNLQEFIEAFRDRECGYNDYIVREGKTLSTICNNDKTFEQDFRSYLAGFDGTLKELLGIERGTDDSKYLNLDGMVAELRKKGILMQYITQWSQIDLSRYNNSEITTLEEHIKRKWADISAETAGEQYTPEDIISLIAEIVAAKIDISTDDFVHIYDPTCGGANLLFGVVDRLRDKAGYKYIAAHGCDWNDALYALAKIESLFRENTEIKYGNTLTSLPFKGKEFDVVVANPPYGIPWKGYEKEIRDDQTGQFSFLPSVSDGQMLFLQHNAWHLHENKGIVVEVNNGSSLFSGDAGSGESNIRKYLFDNDWVEAIIQMPSDEFFNTGIVTYLWILNKNKPTEREDKVILINAADLWQPLKKNKGSKRKEMNPEHRAAIVRALVEFKDCAIAKVYDKWHFYFNKQQLTLYEVSNEGLTVKHAIDREPINLYHEDCYKQIGLTEMADRFIRIGLIAEDYYDYISIFYPGMTSANDHSLILDMKLDRAPDFLSHIDNIKSFLEELPDDVFLTKSVYNVELLDYLSLHPTTEKIRYNLILDLLYTQESFDFIVTYYKEGKNHERVLPIYIQSHPQEIWDKIVAASSHQSILFEIWIKYCTPEQICTVQLDWINENYDFIALIYNTLHHNKRDFLTNKTKYKTLTESSDDMLAKVVENGCYIVSEETIPFIFNQKKAEENIGVLKTNEQKLALKLNLPKPTWKNISTYFKNIDFIIDEALWSFIDDNVHIIAQHKYDGISEFKQTLFQALMNSNHLNMQSYKEISLLFDDCNYEIQHDTARLEEERIIWLAQKGFIEYSEPNIILTSNLSNKAFVEYLIHYKSHFINDIKSYPYNEDIANMILTSQSFTIEEKAIVLPNLNTSNVTMTQSLADSICTLLETKCVKWDFTLLKQAISMASNLDKAVNVTTLTIKQNNNDYTIITELLQALPAPYRKIAENGRRPIIDRTDINKSLLETLMRCGYISSYTPEDKGYRVNTRQKVN